MLGAYMLLFLIYVINLAQYPVIHQNMIVGLNLLNAENTKRIKLDTMNNGNR